MADAYQSFRELAAVEREGEDWELEYRSLGSKVLIMAPHGGWIEPFTGELAREVAGEDLSLYVFRGLTEGRGRRGRGSLHITSHRFDEPVAVRAASEAEWVVAIHGERTRNRPFAMIGGGWVEMRETLEAGLLERGFEVLEPRPGLRGEDPRNICNRGRSGSGCQVELSEGLRRLLQRDAGALNTFVGVLRKAIWGVERGRAFRDRSAGDG